VVLIALAIFSAAPAYADTVKLKNGAKVEGIIKKVEAGNVFIVVNDESKILSILDVESMDFNTPHLLTGVSSVAVEHFMKSTESQEIVRNLQELDKTSAEMKRMLRQIESYWRSRQPIETKEEAGWAAAKETFRKPLMRYQEILNDLYFHVLARVDEYNRFAKEADKVYVGVKGLRVGSSLIPADLEHLPLRKYVPGSWYDTIFYEGYNLGYSDATQKAPRGDR
jgi:hypothetical protein